MYEAGVSPSRWLESMSVKLGNNESTECLLPFEVINISLHPDYCCNTSGSNAVVLLLGAPTSELADASVSDCLVKCADADKTCKDQCEESGFRSEGSTDLFPVTNNGTGASLGEFLALLQSLRPLPTPPPSVITIFHHPPPT